MARGFAQRDVPLLPSYKLEDLQQDHLSQQGFAWQVLIGSKLLEKNRDLLRPAKDTDFDIAIGWRRCVRHRKLSPSGSHVVSFKSDDAHVCYLLRCHERVSDRSAKREFAVTP
jgi:hypothetical protein